MDPRDLYEAVIGLEVHAQMRTTTKAFCGCSTEFGGEPNSNVCPVCLGMPGALPVLNRNLVEFVLKMGVAVDCTIARHAVFARKNYFYPDLPKGYQISQYEEPICRDGAVDIELDDGSSRRIRIARIHMEEDAGKSIHDQRAETLLDLNRCGVPLIEIVSEPDLRSPREAALYLSSIRQIVMYLGICDGNMEEGSLRCDANVSVRKRGEDRFGTKTEVKNLNSFRHVERALQFEIERQISLIEDGGEVIQETVLWDSGRNVAVPMRTKEEAHDYRYFPDPDLVPLEVAGSWIEGVRGQLPELPAVRRDRFIKQLGLPRYDAEVLTAEKTLADYFEESLTHLSTITITAKDELAKTVSNWVMTEVLRAAGERKERLEAFPVSPARLAALIVLVKDGTLSGKTAKEVFDLMLTSVREPKEIAESMGLLQVSDAGAIANAIASVLGDHPEQVKKYVEGSVKLRGFFVGEVMKATGGKANPAIVQRLLDDQLAAKKG